MYLQPISTKNNQKILKHDGGSLVFTLQEFPQDLNIPKNCDGYPPDNERQT